MAKRKKISKNKYRKLITEQLRKDCLKSFMVCQRRPMTIVYATFDHFGEEVVSFGWSKVCHPDVWDREEGLNLALKRAAANAAKDIALPLIGGEKVKVNGVKYRIKELNRSIVIRDKYGKRVVRPTVCAFWEAGEVYPPEL